MPEEESSIRSGSVVRMLGNPLRIAACVLIALLITVCASCRKEGKLGVASSINPRKTPTMSSTNVATFISDSGILQYKLVTPLWVVFNELDTPYWNFPKGIYLRKYDAAFKVVASVAADSAHYLSREKLWRLDGHVEIHNGADQLFLTNQLFWNEREHTLRSDSFIHVETATHILEGHGFVSNERLTSYRIIKPTGVFPVNQQKMQAEGPTAPPPAPPLDPQPHSRGSDDPAPSLTDTY